MATRRRHKKHSLFLAIHRIITLSVVFGLVALLAWHFMLPAPSLEAQVHQSPLSQVTIANATSSATSSHYQREKDIYNILLAGSDAGNGNADTIIVMQFNGNTGQINLVSVPRDSLIYREWSNFPKLNAGMSQGIEMLKSEVSYTLGIPLDFYVQIGLDGFIAVVDALGGLDFYVPQDMYHDDQGGFIIDLQEGQQTLDGRHTLELVRYRGYANADIGRTQTQQAVLKALALQGISLGNLTKVEEFWGIFQEHVNTNLETNDFLWFAKIVLANYADLDIQTLTLEGDGRGVYHGYSWCYELNQEKTLEAVNTYLNPYDQPRTLADLTLIRADHYNS